MPARSPLGAHNQIKLAPKVGTDHAYEGLLSDEHFSVDGTLIEAQANIKSVRRRDDQKGPPDDDPGNPWVDFRGERSRNETHRSGTDPEARLMRKGKGREARLAFTGHALMENGNGLLLRGEQGDGQRPSVTL